MSRRMPNTRRPICKFLVLATLIGITSASAVEESRNWEEGWLHVHHISTGRGDSAFAIMPDGTGLLIDAGDLDPGKARNLAPLVTSAPKPDDTRSAATVIAEYLAELGVDQIDYAVITHFDNDHYGHVSNKNGVRVLSGIAELDSLLPIDVLIDRGYPGYDFPTNLIAAHKETRPAFLLYRQFVRERDRAARTTQGLEVGSTSQIAPIRNPGAYPTFQIRNVKASNLLWTGHAQEVSELFSADDMLNAGIGIRENPLSIVLVIQYGDFEYFTGGDLTGEPGLNKPQWFDVETPVARVVGEVDVATLNHHGNRSSMNINLLRSLQPRVFVQQSWVSDHPGSEVVRRMGDPAIYPGDRDVFATYVHPASEQTIGRKLVELYRSYSGHIVVRVAPGGDCYWVDVLDDADSKATLIATYGPYKSRNQAGEDR